MKYPGVGFLLILMSASTLQAGPREDYGSRFLNYPYSTECAGILKSRVRDLVSDQSVIRKYDFIARSSGSFGNSLPSGFESWVSFSNCKGNLVVEADESCHIIQSYTLGNCRISGVKHY